MQPILLIVGTRPEAIKMIPVYWALKKYGAPVLLCAAKQHTQMLEQTVSVFNITPEIVLENINNSPDLNDLASVLLLRFKDLLQKIKPGLVLVQGDTSSAFAGALAAFYYKIPVGHVEAGLRSYDLSAPFPEEAHRAMIARLATYHFAPTQHAIRALQRENINPDAIIYTGNTIVDALYWVKERISNNQVTVSPFLQEIIQVAKTNNKKIAVLTTHRREWLGSGIERILATVDAIAREYKEQLLILYPYHLNPCVIAAIESLNIKNNSAILLVSPLAYHEFIYCLLQADFVITDSGGVQEEAVSLGRPVLVLRDKTERPEGVFIGAARLIGANPEAIRAAIVEQLSGPTVISEQAIYGDGLASQRIAEFIVNLQETGGRI